MLYLFVAVIAVQIAAVVYQLWALRNMRRARLIQQREEDLRREIERSRHFSAVGDAAARHPAREIVSAEGDTVRPLTAEALAQAMRRSRRRTLHMSPQGILEALSQVDTRTISDRPANPEQQHPEDVRPHQEPGVRMFLRTVLPLIRRHPEREAPLEHHRITHRDDTGDPVPCACGWWSRAALEGVRQGRESTATGIYAAGSTLPFGASHSEDRVRGCCVDLRLYGGAVPAGGAQLMRLFCDLDGVLADFDGGYEQLTGRRPDAAGGVDWGAIERHGCFYLELDLMPDARQLWGRIRHHSPIILTGLPQSITLVQEHKRTWVARHFGSDIEVRCCLSKNKWMHALPGDLLIDDREQYRQLWVSAGGQWVTHRSAAETAVALDQLNL